MPSCRKATTRTSGSPTEPPRWLRATGPVAAALLGALLLGFLGALTAWPLAHLAVGLGDEPFEGGSAEDAVLRLGTGRFIPGFEEQLVGLTAGEEKSISVTFPDDYAATRLAGKAATFDVTVKEVAAPDELVIDDNLDHFRAVVSCPGNPADVPR